MAERYTAIFADQIADVALADGLKKNTTDDTLMEVALKANDGLAFDSAEIKVDYDDSTVGIKTNKLAVKDGGIDTLQMALDAVDETILDLSRTYDFESGGGDIRIATTPANDKSVVNKEYVDSVASGLQVKESCRVATTGNVTLSGLQTIDGISLSAGDRVLVKAQTNGVENGIYEVVSGGAWTRASDYAIGDAVRSTFMFIEEGTANADTGWVCTNDAGSDIVGTDALNYVQFSSAGEILAGAGLGKSGNTLYLDIDNLTEVSVDVSSDYIAFADSSDSDTTRKESIADLVSAITGNGLTDSSGVMAVLADILSTTTTEANAIVVGANGVSVKVDDSTIEGSLQGVAGAETLRVKDEGITEAKLDVFNAPTVGYYLGFTANGMEWVDIDGDFIKDDDYISNEIPSGLINSSNVTFTLANTPINNQSVSLFLNGLFQAQGVGLDYTISGSTITFVKAPRTNSELYATYIKS